jgi:hypothetical protein
MKLIITIDTEADNQWARSDKIELQNIDYIPRFQELCDVYRFTPTYLMTYEMAASDRCIETIGPYQAEKRAEIGAHLHPWTNPPLFPLTADDYKYHPFPHEYPEEVLREKLTMLTETIEQNFGQRPVTFRAGRYGFDGTVGSILSDLGYLADCSVTPLVSWKYTMGNPQGHGGPDFSSVLSHPYFLDFHDCTRAGTSRLLEVPVTIFFLQGRLFNKCFHVLKRSINDSRSLMLRVLYKMGIKPVWFRPHPDKPLETLIQVYRTVQALEHDYVEMIFHSSELMPGGSKNIKNHEAVEQLYVLFEGLFDVLSDEKVQGVTLADYAKDVIRNVKGKNV